MYVLVLGKADMALDSRMVLTKIADMPGKPCVGEHRGASDVEPAADLAGVGQAHRGGQYFLESGGNGLGKYPACVRQDYASTCLDEEFATERFFQSADLVTYRAVRQV